MRRQRWEALSERVTDRGLRILDDLEQFRLLTTRHVQRLHFPVGNGGHASFGAATKAAMRALGGMEKLGVIARLEQRIGGVRGGSQAIIWQLTPTGSRIQQERRGAHGKHTYGQPSTFFTQHTLAVSEVGVIVRELERAGRFAVLDLEGEPGCWRIFTGPGGVPVTLKPDLTVVTAAGEFEDHTYVEVDRASEHVPKVLDKCRLYAMYAATGSEQRARGVFPLVLWLVPSASRASKLRAAIDKSLPDSASLFRVRLQSEAAEALIEPTKDDGVP